MEVDRGAPAIAAGEIEIAADAETVWDVMADIDRWPSWNPDVKAASLSGPLAEGAEFRWKAGSGTIASTIRRAERPRELAWTGRTLGIDAVHVWRLEPRNGATLVSTEESWNGLVVRLLRRPLAKMLQGAIDAGLRHLKAEAERRAAG
jgi:hypothetical protein